MNAKQLFIATALGAASLASGSLIEGVAHAQDATTGAIQGIVKDKVSGEALIGVTVVVTGPTIQAQTVSTDENGFYKVSSLPPAGGYLVTFYYADITVTQKEITVGVNKVTPIYMKLDTSAAGGETIVVKGAAPTIDPTSTNQGITLDQNYLDKIPVPGRNFEDTLGAAAGSQGDGLGVAFSGSTSLENQYIVDGVNTTGLQFGNAGSAVINDFIQEIEVITGGYDAEYGRATGGVVNVVTKSGTNELKGSVFGAFTPGILVAGVERTPTQAAAIDATQDLDSQTDFGFEVGGPIIKDRLWYWVGVDPTLSSATITRTTKTRTDCRRVLPDGSLSFGADQACTTDAINMYRDGKPDVDPETGFYITEDLDTSKPKSTARGAQVLGKINFAATPEHQGQLSLEVAPYSAEFERVYGIVQDQRLRQSGITIDGSAKWTSKFNDNKTEVEAVAGMHRQTLNFGSTDSARNNMPLQDLVFGNLGTWSDLDGGTAESRLTRNGCIDDAGTGAGGQDKYVGMPNCPDEGVGYAIGGPGSLASDSEQRLSAKLSAIERIKAIGTHEIKAGIDGEDNGIDNARQYSGNAFMFNLLDRGEVDTYRWIKVGPKGDPTDPDHPETCIDSGTNPNTTYPCAFLTGSDPEARVNGETINWGSYLQDSWQLRPNLTFNYGVRYEEQRLRYVKSLQNTDDPLTGRHLGTDAMTLQNLWAPRLGLLYDWTKEGRSKLYGHWGRFYESIPMDINNRSFGGEVTYLAKYDGGQCVGQSDPAIGGVDGNNCLTDPTMIPANGGTVYGSGVLVEPGIKPEYMDEIVLGGEYEIMEDLKLGISYQNRKLGRVIEDVSTDGAATYIISNPGEFDKGEEADLQYQIDHTDDPVQKGQLQSELENYQGVRIFDKPKRDYNALQFTITRRFSKAFYMQGSYTYSRTEGNYPGSVSYDNGQIDPNISSQYDLIELLANREGPLPQDRPHYVKIDGYYTFDFKKAGQATAGIRMRALSGTPVNVLGKHYKYGIGESFILPRGQLERTDFNSGLDVHLDYSRDLGHGMNLELYTDLYNVFNDQGVAGVDEDYTYLSSTNPIVGGTYEDVVFAKANGDTSGVESPDPIHRNPNFRQVNARYSPFSAQFGLKLSF